LRNDKIPGGIADEYLAYAACKVLAYNKNIKHSFVPLAPAFSLVDTPIIQATASFSKAPILSVQNLDTLHYGHSFLFSRYGTN